MAIERRNPLPPGRYWIDAFDPQRNDFRTWLDSNKEFVHVENQKEYLPESGQPSGAWYLFTVSEPVHWQGPGLPTIADESVHEHDDTAQKPPPEPSGVEVIENAFSTAGNVLTIAGLGLGGLLLYKLLSK